MLQPSSIAACAARRTGSGTGVSHTPWARLIPPAFAQAMVMLRIGEVRAHARLMRRTPARVWPGAFRRGIQGGIAI